MTVPASWTPEAVRHRLGDAVRIVERTVGRVGPKGPGSAWPEIMPDVRDLWWQAQTLDEHAAARNAARLGATALEVSEAEEALSWLRFVRHERPRRGLQIWLQCQARDASFRDATREAGLAYRTAIRWRDEAVAAIVDGLNKSN